MTPTKCVTSPFGSCTGEYCEGTPEGPSILSIETDLERILFPGTEGRTQLGKRGGLRLFPTKEADFAPRCFRLRVAGHFFEGLVHVSDRLIGSRRVSDEQTLADRRERAVAEAQVRLGTLAIDPHRDPARNRFERLERGIGERVLCEHGHYAQELSSQQQGVAREGDHSFAPRPFLVAYAGVIARGICQMWLSFLCDKPDLEFP